METSSLAFAIAACGGEIIRAASASEFQRVCTDSRSAQAGDLFVALAGEKFDGHAFLDEVAAKGAVAVVIEQGRRLAALPECGVIQVASTRAALGQLGAAYRRLFDLPVIAIGGSNGKTTTKELIASVLKQKLATLWSEASFNNDIGVPMTLLRLEKAHQAAVLEVGTNHPGELAPLVEMIQPRFGVITSIGREHLEFFGDVAGVAKEEGALAELLPADGKLFISGDSEWTDGIAQRTKASVVRVGLSERCEWRARNVRISRQGTSFRVDAPDENFSRSYRVPLVGRHQALNALFAIALGAELGLSREEILQGLAACAPAKMRMEVWETGGVHVLDDAYNANADSMLAALQVLQELPCKGRRVAVLGDMAELGAHSESAHVEVGRNAARLGVAQLFAVGKMASVMANGAREAGLNRVLEFGDVGAAATALKSFLKPGDTVLLKASRASRLERVTMALRSGSGK
ncbi:MAG: UDP-N-acetylmuramoyl-tripeptide--D-alanyl-D-alanine ligase [Verrucomicrobia bacterium]|nr:MAG: UDP-N-acetylmuramoyl-tripeptide--D-alanyl-D-alanine ligase [Verrucomicrobiota bacterium]